MVGNSGKIWRVTGHICTYCFSVILIIWSGENPRLWLYAHGFSVLYKFIAVWFFALAVEVNGEKGVLGSRFTREPEKRERSRPWKDSRTRKPAGIFGYIMATVTLLFMIGVVLSMGGAGFLSPRVMIPELGWALLIALIYLLDDLFNRQLIVASNKNVPQNLGYNVGGLNFLMAAVFISAFLLLITMGIGVWFFDRHRPLLVVEWSILLILGFIRLVYDIRKN